MPSKITVLPTFPHLAWEPVNVLDISSDAPKTRKIRENTTNMRLCNQARRNVQLQIQEARTRKGLTQKQLAKIVNLEWTLIRDLEKNAHTVEIDAEVLDVVCRALNISRNF